MGSEIYNSLYFVLIIFFWINFLINRSLTAEIDDFVFDASINPRNVSFNFRGNLIRELNESYIFIITQAGYFSSDYFCIISNQNCMIKPVKLTLNIGPEEKRLKNGSTITTNWETQTLVDSPALVIFPSNSKGVFSIKFSLLDVVKKEVHNRYSILEFDIRERYKLDELYILETTIPIKISYFSLKIPEGFVPNESSKFCYINICDVQKLCKSCYNLKRLPDNSYTLSNVNYSNKPYVSDLNIPAHYSISLQAYLERSDEFILEYTILALLAPFFVFLHQIPVRDLFIKKIIKFFSPFTIYLFFRTNVLNISLFPVRIHDICFFVELLLLLFLTEKRGKNL
jgi:hypothetical protein